MRTSLVALAALGVLVTADVHAAIPKDSSVSAPASSLNRTKEILGLPMMERLSRLQDQGPAGYSNLVKIMFDEKAGMDLRWKAVTAAGRVGGKDASPEIEKTMKHSSWYMRNAGLIAMRTVDRSKAMTWAQKLLSDEALVVRSAAVGVIADLGDRQSASVLWQKINAPENFKNGQGLFIRRQMAEALARLDGRTGQEAKFIGLLNDKDSALHEPAMRALERITKQSMAVSAPANKRRAEWLRWWNERRG